jgi:hypothetical protein
MSQGFSRTNVNLISAVTSVNTLTGDVLLTTANIPESSNLYYTDTRARNSISSIIAGITYTNTTGVLSLTSGYIVPTTTQESNWNSAYSASHIQNTDTGSDASTFSLTGVNGLVIGKDETSGSPNIAGQIKLWSAGDNAFYNSFISGINTANTTYTLPTAMPTSSAVLKSDTAGVLSWETKDTKYAGVCVKPSYTDNLDGSVTIGSGTYHLYSAANTCTAILEEYIVSGNTFSLSDATTNYIIVNYNSGTPVLQNTTNVAIIDCVTIIPVFTIYREGTILHLLDWDQMALTLPEKFIMRFVKTSRFVREIGLLLSELATRIVYVSDGTVWYGAVRQLLSSFSSNSNVLNFWYHVGGVWTQSIATQYNNSQYDDGTNLQSLGVGRYSVNWIYRSIETNSICYMVLGTGDYKLSEAQASQPPAGLPNIINSNGMLVGRIIVLNGGSTATQIDSAFNITFSPSSVSNHNDLSGIQDAPGSVANEHYHLSSAQATIATQAASGTLSGYLSTGDWTIFNNKENALTFSTGLNRSTNTITANISTGVAGGQTIYGGTLTTQGLTIQANAANTTTGTVTINTSTSSTASNIGALVVNGGLGVGENINCAGSIQAWSANGLIAGENVAGGSPNVAGSLKLWSAGDNAFYNSFTSGTNTATATYTLPTAMPSITGYVLTSTTAGVLSWESVKESDNNLISNGHFFYDTAGWVTQTGLTIQRSTVYDNQGSALISKDNQNRSGSYISIPFTVPSNSKGQPYTLQYMAMGDVDINIFDWRVTIYDLDTSNEISNSYFSTTNNPHNSFNSFHATSTNYELRIYCDTTSTNVKSFYISDIILKNGSEYIFNLTSKSIYSENFIFNSTFIINGILFANSGGTFTQDASLIYDTSAKQLVLGEDKTSGTVNTPGSIKLWSAGDNAFYNSFTSGTNTANATYTLPTAMPINDDQQLTCTTAGVLSWKQELGYGGVYFYDSASNFAINTVNAYHCLKEVVPGSLHTGLTLGCTYNVGRSVDANVTSEANNGGKLQIVCSVNHLLTNNDIVVITNANNTAHNSQTRVTVDNATTFTCQDINYVAGAGESNAIVDEPAYIQLASNFDGAYHISFTGSFSTGTNKDIKIEVNKNATPLDNIVAERVSSTSISSIGSAGNVLLAAGDRIWISAMNKTDTTDITLVHGNLNLHKIA